MSFDISLVDISLQLSIQEVNRNNNSNKNSDLESLNLNDILDLVKALIAFIIAKKQQKSKAKLSQKSTHFLLERERIDCIKEILQEPP